MPVACIGTKLVIIGIISSPIPSEGSDERCGGSNVAFEMDGQLANIALAPGRYEETPRNFMG